MAIQRQLRRGTKGENDSFTGAIGELVQDTDNNRIIVHDGSQTGGFPVPNYLDLQSRYFTTGDATQDTTGDYVLNLPYAPISYMENQVFTIVPDSNNLGACDINVNGLGLKDLQKFDEDGLLVELENDDLKTGVPNNIFYNGARFVLIQNGSGGGSKPIVSVDISSPVTEIDFNSVFKLNKNYRLVVSNLEVSNDSALVYLRFSTDGGTTYDSTSYQWGYIAGNSSNTVSNSGAFGTGYIQITASLGNAVSEGLSCEVFFYNPFSLTNSTNLTYQMNCENQSGVLISGAGGGKRFVSESVNSFRIYPSSGTFVSAKLTLFEEDI